MSKLQEYPGLSIFRNRYQSMRFQPLTITAIMRPGSPIASYDPIHLDNFLAWIVVQEATLGQGLPNTDSAYDLPIPVQCLWRDSAGMPLWAASCFHPVGDSVADVQYWHKRAQSGRFTGTKTGNFTVKTTAGRFMERRTPMPVSVAESWRAWAIGNPEEILRLLQNVRHIGKRRHAGLGDVQEWRVEAGDFAPAPVGLLVRDNTLSRPLPTDALCLIEPFRIGESASMCGWTPPEWKPSLHRLGWRTGTRVHAGDAKVDPNDYSGIDFENVDYFGAVESLGTPG